MCTDLLGVKFHKDGPPRGHNCRSLVEEICKRAGLAFPKGNWIDDLCDRDAEIHYQLMKHFVELPKPEAFCLVTFKIRTDWVTHMGVVLGDRRRFLHITRKRGVACERITKWEDRIDGFYRYNQHNAG